jgi:hypothetical protein
MGLTAYSLLELHPEPPASFAGRYARKIGYLVWGISCRSIFVTPNKIFYFLPRIFHIIIRAFG